MVECALSHSVGRDECEGGSELFNRKLALLTHMLHSFGLYIPSSEQIRVAHEFAVGGIP